MATSTEQIRANRENANLSTGPVTPEGKRKVSMNAMKHSFAGQTCLLQEHEMEGFKKHFESFRREYAPVGPTEEFMVQSLAEISWSTQQLRSASGNALTIAGNRDWPDMNAAYPPEVSTAIARSRAVELNATQINLFSVYENRKMRLFNTTFNQLAQMQKVRRAREQAEMEEAAKYRKLCKLNRDPNHIEWKPSEFGFECSLESVDRYIVMEDRMFSLQKKAA